MKKWVLSIIFIVSFFVFSCASAEIWTGKDDFTNGKILNSYIKLTKVSDGVVFKKLIDKNVSTYKIRFSSKVYNDKERYSNSPIQIKIDDNPVQSIDVNETNVLSFLKLSSSDPVIIECIANIPDNIIDQIAKSNRVAFKVYKENMEPFMIVLPEDILTEWKQIINTKE